MKAKDVKHVPCTVCGDPTPMLGTELCDRCWELKDRIERNPELARQILAALKTNATPKRTYIPDGPANDFGHLGHMD